MKRMLRPVHLTCFTIACLSLNAEEKPIYLPSECPCVSVKTIGPDLHVYTQLSFLYWDCVEKGLDFALNNKGSQSNSQITVHQPSFHGTPALRILLGTHLPHNAWNLDLSYSLFLHHQSIHMNHDPLSAFGEGFLATWTSPGAFQGENIYARWKDVEGKWKLHANIFDLLLRRDVCVGKNLAFQPAVGVKMALLQQRYVLDYQFGNTIFPSSESEQSFLSSSVHMKNRSFNIGPTISGATRWHMNSHWNIFSSLSGSLLASHFGVGRNELDLSTTSTTTTGSYRFNDQFWTFRPQASLVFGLQWKGYTKDPHSVLHYGFSVSYETQYWWKQNMLLRHFDAAQAQSSNISPVRADLFFQGATFDILFDF